VFITIDDGPWVYTQEIAEELHKRGHRATFFVIWNNINEDRYEAMKNAEEMWHEFWNHSLSHENFRKLTFDQAKEQLEKTEKWIKAAWVTPAPYFRYPYGASFSNEKFDAYMKWLGYEEVFRTIDTRDWSKSTTKKDIIKCLEKAKPWDIILIHEKSYTKDKTIPVIDSVLKSKNLISVPYRKK
jgi:peptidoglycan/xylan/chitin deacetylase (PgdA/CDA1 family)